MDAERQARLGSACDRLPVRRLLVVRQRSVDCGREGAKDRRAVTPEFGQPGLSAPGRSRPLDDRRVIPPERLSAGRRVGDDEHGRGDLELAQHGPSMVEDAAIRIVEGYGGKATE